MLYPQLNSTLAMNQSTPTCSHITVILYMLYPKAFMGKIEGEPDWSTREFLKFPEMAVIFHVDPYM